MEQKNMFFGGLYSYWKIHDLSKVRVTAVETEQLQTT